MNKFDFDPKVLAGTFACMQIEMSLPIQEELLDAANELISETRESIISGGKSTEEMNALLDTLASLTLKKYFIETRVAQLKRMHAIKDERVARLAEEIVLVKDDRTLKEILEEG